MNKNFQSREVNFQSGIFFYSCCFLTIILLLFIFDFNGLYGQDSYEYLRYAKCLYNFFKSGIDPGDYFWPLNYPLAGAVLSFCLKTAFALQFISAASFILSAYYLDKIIRVVFPDHDNKSRIYLLLFYLLSPFALRASVVIMSDMLAICFVVLTFYHFVLFKKLSRLKNFYALIFFFSASVMTRYAAAVVLIVPVIYSCLFAIRKINFKSFPAALFLILLPAIPHLLIRRNRLLEFIHHPTAQMWSVANIFSNNFLTPDGYSHYKVFNLIYSLYNFFHPGFIFPGILFLVVLFKKIKFSWLEARILVVSIILYAIFIAGIPFQNTRFLLLSFPFVILLFFPAYKEIQIEISRFRKMSTLIIILAGSIQVAFTARAIYPFYLQSETEREIASELLHYPGKTIYTFSIDGALKNYDVNNKIINLYSIKLDSVEKPSLVLFNEKNFSGQWKGMNPMLNWEFIKIHCELKKLKDLPRDWILYEAR